MSETYGTQINSFASVVNKFDKTIKLNSNFQKNLINSTNAFYIKMSKKYEADSKIQKTFFEDAIKPFRDIANSIKSISENINILVKKQNLSNRKLIANISGDSVFGTNIKARKKQKGFLSTLVRQIQMSRTGVSGIAIAKETEGKKKFGPIGSFSRAFKAVYNQWELPFQERMLQSLLDMRMAFVDSNKGMKQVWARVLFESPYFRTLMLVLNTFKRLSRFFILRPLKWLFGERGAVKYSGRLPKSGTAFDRTAITLGLLYTGTMYRLDKLIYTNNESLKQLILLSGQEVTKKDKKYSIFGKYGGSFIKNIFSNIGEQITGKIPGVGKKRKIKALEIKKAEGLKEWFSVRNLMMEQIDVLKAIYFGITKEKYTAGVYTKRKQDYLLNIEDELDDLKRKKKKKIDWKTRSRESVKTLRQDYQNFLLFYKKVQQSGYLKSPIKKFKLSRIKANRRAIRKDYLKRKEYARRRKSGRNVFKVLSDMHLLSKRQTEYQRQSKLNFAKLNFRAKRGFSKIIWGGLMILSWIKKVVGGVLGLPLKIITTLVKYGPSLGLRLGIRSLLSKGKGALAFGKKVLPTIIKGAKVLGPIAAAVAVAYDAYQGVKKSEEWYGKKATKTEKVASGIGAALGGTSGAFTAKGAAYGALKGGAIGAMVGGPLAPLTGALGAIVGGILGYVGGKNISKFLMEFTKPLKLLKKVFFKSISWLWNSFKKAINFAVTGWKDIFSLIFGGMFKRFKKWKSDLWKKISSPFIRFYDLFTGFVESIKNKMVGMLQNIPFIGKYFKDNKSLKTPESNKVSNVPNLVQTQTKTSKIPGMATGGVANNNMLAYLHKGEEVKPKKYVDKTVDQLKLLNAKLDPKAPPMKSIFSKFLDNWKTGFEIIRDKYTKDETVKKVKEESFNEIMKSFKGLTPKKEGEKHLLYSQGGLKGRLSLPERIAGMNYSPNISKKVKTNKPIGSYLVNKNDTIKEIIESTGATWQQLISWNPDSWGQLPINHPIYPGHFFFKEGANLKVYKKGNIKDIKNNIEGITKSDIAKNIVGQKRAEGSVVAKNISDQNKNIIESTNKQNTKNTTAIVQTMTSNTNSVNNFNNTSQQVINSNSKNQRLNLNLESILSGDIR